MQISIQRAPLESGHAAAIRWLASPDFHVVPSMAIRNYWLLIKIKYPFHALPCVQPKEYWHSGPIACLNHRKGPVHKRQIRVRHGERGKSSRRRCCRQRIIYRRRCATPSTATTGCPIPRRENRGGQRSASRAGWGRLLPSSRSTTR